MSKKGGKMFGNSRLKAVITPGLVGWYLHYKGQPIMHSNNLPDIHAYCRKMGWDWYYADRMMS